MRFIIKEQPYEKIVAAGKYRYEMDGVPTGAVESWRVTAVADGYQFLRVDLDAREAESGHSYLYHAVLNPDEQVERLKFRFWGDGLEIVGDVVLDDEAVTTTRDVNGTKFDQVLDLPKGYNFWFPSTMGLGLANRFPAREIQPSKSDAVTLKTLTSDSDEEFLALERVDLYLSYDDDNVISKDNRAVASLLLEWDHHTRRVWSDEWMVPVRMERGDGLTAVAVRYTIYK